MAGDTKFAVVEFQDPPVCVYITHIDNVPQFFPKHAKDFVRGQIYPTKWQRSFHGSSDTESFDGLCPAKILLLGGGF